MKHSDRSLQTEGNRGEISHRDVVMLSLAARSLGSVALRKAENLDRRIHMNVFTIDFNEELVALYGGSLRRQTQFLYESIKAILRLYKVRGQGHFPPVPLLPIFPKIIAQMFHSGAINASCIVTASLQILSSQSWQISQSILQYFSTSYTCIHM